MSDYLRFLAQQMRYEDFIREAETNRLIAQARAGKQGGGIQMDTLYRSFNSLAVLGLILFAILVMAIS